MPVAKKINFKKIGRGLGKLPKILGEKAFLTFFALFAMALIIGGGVFYKYNILSERFDIPASKRPLRFNEEDYRQVLEKWQLREQDFQSADSKEYPNPFK